MDWETFRAKQKKITLTGVAHIPVEIRYIDEGVAERGVILLMHGIPTWSFLYRDIIPKFTEKGYRVIAPDFLGHGFSDMRDRFDRSFQDQAKMISILLNDLNIAKPINIVGHDTGGAVALILAIEYSHLVKSLTICNSVCYDRFDDDMLDLGHPIRWKPRSIEEMKAVLEESLEQGLSNQSKLTEVFKSGILAPWMTKEGKLSLIRNASALNSNQTMALIDRHGNISVPTLVIWGEDDPWQKISDGRQLASEIPKAQFRCLHNVSHWVQQDAPNEFARCILEFLQAC